MKTDLTHIDENGRARMVDVGDKPPTEREGRRVRVGVSRRLRMRLSIAEERVKADARQSTQLTMLRQETDRYR